MTDKLRDKVACLLRYEPQGEPDHHNGTAWMAEDDAGEWIKRDDVLAALAAAPQPAPVDREALVEVIREAWQSHEAALRAVLAERDALQGQLDDLRNGWANSVKAHSEALAERDAAFAAGLQSAVAICKRVRSEVAENEAEATGALECAIAIMDEVNDLAANPRP